MLTILAISISWASFHAGVISRWWFLVPAFAFVAAGVLDDRVMRQKKFALTAVQFYERGLRRLRHDWQHIGETGERFADPHHIYAADLDLFGRGSLFQLASTARTKMGEGVLANWFLSPAPIDAIRERQAAVAELRDRLDLREDVAVIGENIVAGVNGEALVAWAESPREFMSRRIRAVAFVFAALAVAGVVVWVKWSVWPFIVVLFAEAALQRSIKKRIERVTHSAEHAFEDLGLLADVLARFECEKFASPLLVRLQSALVSHATPPSVLIARLRRLSDLIESRHNLITRFFDLPLMYSVQLAFAAENWRSKHGTHVRMWLNAVGELEALLSLASYSFEHPEDPYPQFVDGPASFEARGLAHPLLPTDKCVRNDVSIGRLESPVFLVSGSNMSGKSTLLRAVGINAVLAMAGAPVSAETLRLSPLQVGASLRVADSLQEGASRFYAEITRLRQIVDFSSSPLPLLFLIDEFLQGTNSRDRLVGAEALIAELVRRGSIGLVTTHDLALTQVAVDGQLKNVHFQDYIEDGRMRFDYKLRDGVVARSNGLELMRSIGLDV